MTREFALKSGATFKVTAKNKRKSNQWGQTHFAYTIVIVRDGLEYKTTYHDSPMNYWHNHGADERMLLSAIDSILMDSHSYEENTNLCDFMDEYGYDYEEEKGVKAYLGCFEAYTYINRMFTLEEQMEIEEMVD